ncbi:glutamate--tRNA ligase [Alkalispirochaeta americana]|nr:glutamate--tRNA ligase [Alkalispirochaeta americana]
MSEKQVRVRYAPSPTGMQHIGGIRTALFNYFFARSKGGSFILRIEDTDQTRFHEDALRDIYETFSWLGIEPDESPDHGGDFGPYVQSQRLERYQKYAEELIASGRAYRDYTSAQRGDQGAAPYAFEGRNLSPEDLQRYKDAGVQPVVRLLVPQEGKTEFDDLVLGRIKRKNKDLPPDPILLKSDGFPTYHLANVVDDHQMEITHVLRAQEWVPSTPIHLLIYDAFGWEPPRFAHLPMVMGKDGAKLSKRHGATSVIEFRRQGYLAEAVMNYVTLLGWSYDDSREFFSCRDLEQLFAIEKINKAPAVFDYRKLDWFNGQYLRELSPDRLVDELLPWLQAEGWATTPATEADRDRLLALIPLIQERLKLLQDVVPLTRFLYQEVDTWEADALTPKKASAREALEWLDQAWAVVEKEGFEDQEKLDEAFRKAADAAGTKVGNLLMPLRVALTGGTVSPPLVGSLRELGLERARKRLAGARTVLEAALS